MPALAAISESACIAQDISGTVLFVYSDASFSELIRAKAVVRVKGCFFVGRESVSFVNHESEFFSEGDHERLVVTFWFFISAA